MQKTDVITGTTEYNFIEAAGLTMAGCVLIAAAVCFAQIRGNTMIIALTLLAFLAFHVRACGRGKTFDILLFFLPWSQLLRLNSGGISFYTIALLLSCVISLAKNGYVFRVSDIILAALTAALTLTAKAIHGASIDNSYMCFLVMLLLFPGVARESLADADFPEACIFFASGIISAALSAQQAAGYANMIV